MEIERGDLPAPEVLGPHRAAAWIARAAVVAVLAAAALAVLDLARIVRSEPGLPLWDEAAQGFAGLELAEAVRHARPLWFLLFLNQQVVWPFVHALLLLPGFPLLGSGFDTPALVSAALFGATVALALHAGRALHPVRGVWIGALAAWLVLASPAYRVFGTVGMLEMPGALLLALTLALHLRGAAPAPSRALLVAAGASTAALVLLKYNYGLLWLAPLLAHEFLLVPPERRRRARERALAWLRAGGLLRPAPLVLALGGIAVGAIVATGGFELDALGRRISVRSPGNLAYFLLVFAAGWTAAAVLRAPAAWRARWRALAPRRRILLATVGAPLLAWFLIPWPNRVKALAGFLMNRESGPASWSLEGLLYYPRAFAAEYSPDPALGWTVLALALVPPRGGGRGAWLLYFALIVGLAATVAHRYHHPRFLFPTALLVWLSAARTVVGIASAVIARAPRALAEGVWAAGLVAALWLVRAPSEERVREGHRAWRASETLLPAVDRALGLAARERGGSVLLGYSYALSPGLLSWRARQSRPGFALAAIPKRAPWLDAGADETAISARLERLLAPGALVIAALPTPRSPALTPAYRAEVWADSVSAARLARDPRVRVERDTILAAVRLTAFRVRGVPAPKR